MATHTQDCPNHNYLSTQQYFVVYLTRSYCTASYLRISFCQAGVIHRQGDGFTEKVSPPPSIPPCLSLDLASTAHHHRASGSALRSLADFLRFIIIANAKCFPV